MPACQGLRATVPLPEADVDSAGSFLDYLYIVSQYTVRLMTPCVWRILCLRNSSSVPYFRQPPNLPTAARRNRKCTECGTTAFCRNWMSTESAHLSTFGAETETVAEIRSTFIVLCISPETPKPRVQRNPSTEVAWDMPPTLSLVNRSTSTVLPLLTAYDTETSSNTQSRLGVRDICININP